MLDNIKKLYIFSFLYSISFFGAISVPFFLEWGKLTYTQIFLIQLWFSLWLVILEVPTGVIADKIGRKKTLIISAFIASFGVLIYGSYPNVYIFLLGELILAIGIALKSGADRALLYDTLLELKKTKEAKHFFSRYTLSHNLGLIVALPLGSLIAGSSILPYPKTLPLTFLLTAIPLSLSALLGFHFLSQKERGLEKTCLAAQLTA